MTLTKPLLCIHGHFYQPPRDDPFTGRYRKETTAAPYNNWNEKITAECYHPNAEKGNFRYINFNLGGTLAKWMDDIRHDTYSRIITDSRKVFTAYGAGNGIAQSVHHTILPLARGRDKRCQIAWGISSFKHRFKYPPMGMWLPELAVDYETLQMVAETGLAYVILSDEQVVGDLSQGAGPYTVHLPDNKHINVFVRNRLASNILAFHMPQSKFAKAWLTDYIQNTKPGLLLLLAADGETFGHHHRDGIQVLKELSQVGPEDAYEVTTLGAYLASVPPGPEIEIRENTAWSCSHNLARWTTGCSCTTGHSYWKGALRRAMDNLSRDIDEIFANYVNGQDASPWQLRDAYIQVVLKAVDKQSFLNRFSLQHKSRIIQHRILDLLQAQLHRQRMFTSCAFYFDDLDGIETRYAIANAVRAMALVYSVTGDDLTRAYRRDLSVAFSERTDRTGAQILDELLARANFGESALGGEMVAPSVMVENIDNEADISFA